MRGKIKNKYTVSGVLFCMVKWNFRRKFVRRSPWENVDCDVLELFNDRNFHFPKLSVFIARLFFYKHSSLNN